MTKQLKMLVLSLTGQCNFNCVYCYASEHSQKIMSVQTAIAAVKMVAQYNAGEPFIIQFSGGEPLLNFSTLQAVVEFVEQNNISCKLQLQTNASLITERIARFLYEHKVAIGISLDGRPSVNDLLRKTKDGKGASKNTLQGIAVLQKLGIACGLTCVVSETNVEKLAEILDFAYYLGNIRVLGFDLLRGQGRGNSLKAATEEQMQKALEDVWQRNEALAKAFGYKIQLNQLTKAYNFKNSTVKTIFSHCHAMTGEAAFINAEGKIYACASFVDDERFYLGNVSHGIDEERSEKVQNLVREAMNFCQACERFDSCGGGCLARWYKQDLTQQHPYKAECALKLFFANKA